MERIQAELDAKKAEEEQKVAAEKAKAEKNAKG